MTVRKNVTTVKVKEILSDTKFELICVFWDLAKHLTELMQAHGHSISFWKLSLILAGACFGTCSSSLASYA
jgi:hypothetical protein